MRKCIRCGKEKQEGEFNIRNIRKAIFNLFVENAKNRIIGIGMQITKKG